MLRIFWVSLCLLLVLAPGDQDFLDALGFESLLSMLLSYQSLRLNCCCHIRWEHERQAKQQGPCLQAPGKHHELVQNKYDLLCRRGTTVLSVLCSQSGLHSKQKHLGQAMDDDSSFWARSMLNMKYNTCICFFIIAFKICNITVGISHDSHTSPSILESSWWSVWCSPGALLYQDCT